ncbi:hypothetical protein N7517_009643 [Penicillium concentricum]|uniref:Uncharacterized protein n=1 Tax=Penicillium concentricum TaxID=293559 RepID=A0A9W9RHZ1_9EURO|nr:uncharacterized protein N7517_009643 [Penicillium concentricum]KAJ5360452.1 hypothetical protein N7517_009643 [Penicillium concentricum]
MIPSPTIIAMANLLQQVFGESPSPPTKININVTTSSTTLHKHGSNNPFTLTLEATLPESANTPTKPLTILTFDTLLDPNGNALYESGIDFINSDTGAHAKRTSLAAHHGFGGKSNIVIDPQFERYFVTLEPGVPYRVTHTMRPCPKLSQESGSKSGEVRTPQQEGNSTAEDEAVIAAAFSHVTSLDVSSTYRVGLGDKMNQISWYRYGVKEEVLKGQGAGGGLVQRLMGTKRHPERVGDSEMQAIPLVMHGSASFRVEE